MDPMHEMASSAMDQTPSADCVAEFVTTYSCRLQLPEAGRTRPVDATSELGL
jgi:hypothetical protein